MAVALGALAGGDSARAASLRGRTSGASVRRPAKHGRPGASYGPRGYDGRVAVDVAGCGELPIGGRGRVAAVGGVLIARRQTASASRRRR